MTFSIILLGVLIILVTFNVGESIYSKLGLKKKWLLILLIGTFILNFVPNLVVFGIEFGWVGFVLPIIFSVIVILKVKSAKGYFKMLVAMLIAFALNIIYNLITFDVYESSIFQPYLILGVLLGTLPLALVKIPTRLYASNTFGILFAEIVFYISRYSIYGDYYLTLGSRKMFETLITSFVVSLLAYFFARKVKAVIIRRKLAKREREKITI